MEMWAPPDCLVPNLSYQSLISKISIKRKKLKSFVTRKIKYFEPGFFSFNSYVYYLTRGFNLLTRASNLETRAFSLLTRGFELVTRGFELVTRISELVTLNS